MSTYASGVTISLGLASTVGKLKTLKRPVDAATKLTTLCPVCKASPARQFYLGECGHVPEDGSVGFKTGQCAKGQKVGDTYVEVTAEEAKAAKAASSAPKILELNVHPAEQVDAQTWPSGSTYWFEPDRQDDFYAVLASKIASSPSVAFTGTIVLSGNEKLVRLLPHNGGIVFQELARPGELNTFAAEVEAKDKYRVLIDSLTETLVEPFDADKYVSTVGEKFRSLIASKTGEPVAEVTPITTASEPVDSLTAALEAALAAATAAKAA